MLYALICTDKPGALPVRMANRPAHLDYIKSLGDAVVLAGPFTADDGITLNGSLIVIEAPSLEAARAVTAVLRLDSAGTGRGGGSGAREKRRDAAPGAADRRATSRTFDGIAHNVGRDAVRNDASSRTCAWAHTTSIRVPSVKVLGHARTGG